MKKNGHTMGNSSGDLMSPLEICGFSRWRDPHIGAGLNRRNTTQQLPLAVAQLLIKRIPPFRTMCNSDAMAITPVLHTHRHPPHPSKPTRSCPHSWTCPQMRFPCVHGPLAPVGHGAHWRSSASGTLLGGSSHVCSQSHRWAPRWWGQEIVLGRGRAEVEG